MKSDELLTLISGCAPSLQNLNISFIQTVTDNLLSFIGTNARNLEILDLRYCKHITNEGIKELCEGLSGFKQTYHDHTFEGKDMIYAKRDYDSLSKLKALNIGDIKNIGNPAMKSIADNLFPALQDLCIWGNYQINSDGFLEICTARNRKL